jgi:hypothetical protein
MPPRELLDIEIDLPYPRPPLHANQRLHRMAVYRLTTELRADAHNLARHHRLPKGLGQVGIVLYWQATVKRSRDNININPTLKPLVDGLVDYGLVPDDDSGHVTTGTVVEPVAPTARLWLRIVELEPSRVHATKTDQEQR